jgi:L-arabinose isomerase
MVRIMKAMSFGLNKGSSFMEDYTYHLEPGNEMALGAHMLEVCPTISATRPRIEVHPLSIGGKADPARLTFDGKPGPAINTTLIDMGDRFRLVINEVDAITPFKPMPKLPVARIMWKPLPSLKDSAEAWILAGGAHHFAFSLDIGSTHMVDWAEIAGVEAILINKDTNMSYLRNELRWNDLIWRMR